MEIVGYTRPVVAHAGEDVNCMVSTAARNYRARLVRLTTVTDRLAPTAFRRSVN